jgi:hypothetical protein
MDQQTQETDVAETNPVHEVKIERGFSRSFMIPLSDHDIAVRAREVSRLLRSIEEKEDARDRAKKQANNEIEELRASVKRLSDEVHDGEERRDIPCERHFIYRIGAVHVIRTDTKEVIDQRPMESRERQTELPLEDGDGSDDSDVEVEPDEDDGEDEDEEKPEPEFETEGEEGGGRRGGRKAKSKS